MAKSTKTKAKRARKPVDPAKKAHRKRNAAARDQFAALGLFIQNFEHIVSTLREECRRIVMGGRYSGVTLTDNRTRLFRWNICSLAFHHEVMTARPLLDIWRALVFEECRALVAVSEMTKAGSAAAAEITKEIASQFQDLIDQRNRLIHASWSIGRWIAEDDFSLGVEKYRVGKDSIQRREDLPRSFEELMALTRSANKLWNKLGRFIQFFNFHPNRIERVFKKRDGEWVFVAPQTPVPAGPPSSLGKSP